MSDPAIEAAHRAWDEAPSAVRRGFADVPDDNFVKQLTIGGAQQALAPLRAKHQRVQRPDGTWRCTSCRDAYGSHADFPTGTDRLIYSSEELDGNGGYVTATVDQLPRTCDHMTTTGPCQLDAGHGASHAANFMDDTPLRGPDA